MGVRNHDGSLSSPQKASTDTEQGTSEDIETCNIGVDRDQQADGVNAVSDASKSQSHLNTQSVDESSTEETEDCESTVESGVLKLVCRQPYNPTSNRTVKNSSPCCLQV